MNPRTDSTSGPLQLAAPAARLRRATTTAIVEEGREWTFDMPFPPGARLGPYEILAALGAGGMGEVYRARDTRLGRDVAIKVIHAEVARDPDRIKRFEQEARAAGALSHENVCAVYDLGAHEGSPYVVMELLEGESLRERLQGAARSRCARRSTTPRRWRAGSRRRTRRGSCTATSSPRTCS